MKFDTTKTKGKIEISYICKSTDGLYHGVVHLGFGNYSSRSWDSQGKCLNNTAGTLDLIPLNQPEPYNVPEGVERLVLEYANEERINRLEERLDQSCKDLIGRINGLRNDYLADQDAVSPARVDDLEERLKKLEAYNSKLDKWRESK